jgi:hypothetical protein
MAGPVYLRRGNFLKECWQSNKDYNVPFVTKNAEIIMHPIGCMKINAQCLFASLVTTVFKKLKSRFQRCSYLKSKDIPCNYTLMRMSACYVITYNLGQLTRLVEMVKHRRSITSAVYRNIQKMDAKQKVLLDQISNQISWFQLRANARAKSIVISKSLEPCSLNKVKGSLKRFLDDWATPYRVA